MDDHIVFVSCVSKKSSNVREARLIYESSWFLKTRTLVEAMNWRWFILSAEHGLLEPSTEIQPYDRTLNTMSRPERIRWANQVIDQFETIQPSPTKITVFAGSRYREFIIPRLEERGVEISIPMEGLRIGEQLRWLSQKTGNH